MKDGASGERISTVFLQHLLLQKDSIHTKLTSRATITALAIILPDSIKSRRINLLTNSTFIFYLNCFDNLPVCIFLALGEDNTGGCRTQRHSQMYARRDNTCISAMISIEIFLLALLNMLH